MQLLVNRAMVGVRRVTEGGRKYLVAPAVMIVPGVLDGSKGALYYPDDETAKSASSWNNTPIVVYHPTDESGNFISARSPGVLDKSGVGVVRNSIHDGKLRAEAWFDEDRTKRIDPRVYSALIANRPLEISTGLHTDNHPSPGEHNGIPYTHIARNYRPDHLAILPDQIGACSVRAGCGLMVNCACESPKSLKKLSSALVKASYEPVASRLTKPSTRS